MSLNQERSAQKVSGHKIIEAFSYSSFNTSSWLPTYAEAYLDLTWNFTAGAVIDPNESLKLIFYLCVRPDISGIKDFCLIITIVAIKERYDTVLISYYKIASAYQ